MTVVVWYPCLGFQPIELRELLSQPLETFHPVPTSSFSTNTRHLLLLHLRPWLSILHIHPLLENSSGSISPSGVSTPLALAVQHPSFLLRLYNPSLKTAPLPWPRRMSREI